MKKDRLLGERFESGTTEIIEKKSGGTSVTKQRFVDFPFAIILFFVLCLVFLGAYIYSGNDKLLHIVEIILGVMIGSAPEALKRFKRPTNP